MTAAKIMIEIDGQGTLHADADTLAKLKNQRFQLSLQGEVVMLEPVPRRLSEIGDPVERKATYENFKKKVMRSGPADLPGDWASIRDSIYD